MHKERKKGKVYDKVEIDFYILPENEKGSTQIESM
jgi:hypothetical protein